MFVARERSRTRTASLSAMCPILQLSVPFPTETFNSFGVRTLVDSFYKHSIPLGLWLGTIQARSESRPHGSRSKVNSTPGFAAGLILSLLPSSLYSHLVVVPIDEGLDCASCCRLITLPCTSNDPQVAASP